MRRLDNMPDIILQAEQFAKDELGRDVSGHDWWHVHRVRRLAVELAKREKANIFICELAALLHDIADEKLNDSKESGMTKVREWLNTHKVDNHAVNEILSIISFMSYNGGKNPQMTTLEGKIVQDADRLDAIGAIGIARTFQYSGWKGQQIHIPNHDFSALDYRSSGKTAIYHFYEKLLKLKDLLNTESAKQIAESRHRFMESYLEQFYTEWELRDV